MSHLLETFAELLKITEKIGDNEGANKRLKEGASTHDLTKPQSKGKSKRHEWNKRKREHSKGLSHKREKSQAKGKFEGDEKSKQDLSQEKYYSCGKMGDFLSECRDNKMRIEVMWTLVVEQVVQRGK